MGFTLDKVVPCSYDEYVSMFNFAQTDPELRILGCGDGPAGFNATLTERGGNVISVDPIYIYGMEQIKARITETYPTVMSQLRKKQDDYVWETIASPEQLGSLRMGAMETFLDDYDAGKRERRYIAGELPSLPFQSQAFDIALSSHFLLLYSSHPSAEFHLQSLLEMLQVSHEVRVFPLLTLDGAPSPHLHFLCEHLAKRGFIAEARRVPYEFQHGGNEMLVIKPA